MTLPARHLRFPAFVPTVTRWHRRKVTALIVAALLGLATLALAPNASAGATAPNPVDGTVAYSAASLTTTCASGVPTDVTMSFHWDATGLHTGYSVDVVLQIATPEPLNPGDHSFADAGSTVATLTADGSGTYSHDFALPAGNVGNVAFVKVSQVGNEYDYIDISNDISCSSLTTTIPLKPTVTVAPVQCDGSAAVTLDNPSASTWSWALFVDGGFSVSDGRDVAPGTSRTIVEPDLGDEIGQPLTMVFQTTTTVGLDFASIDGGNYTLQSASGCGSSAAPTTGASSSTATTASSTTTSSSASTAPVTLGTSSLTPGASTTVTAAGFRAGELVTAVLHSTPITVGSYRASSAGVVSFTLTIPTNFPTGSHTLILTGASSGIVESKAFSVGAAATDLANTGTQTAQLLTLAGVLILVGGLAIGLRLYAGRRRGAHGQAS